MSIKEQIKNFQKEILINEELIDDLNHYDRLSSIFSLTKPLSLVLPPILSILIILEIAAKIVYTGGTGSKRKKLQEIAFYQEKIKEYEEEIKTLQQRITFKNSLPKNISSNKLIPNHNLQRKLVRQKPNY